MFIPSKVNRIFKKPVVYSWLLFVFLVGISVLFLSRDKVFGPDILDRILDRGEIVVITRNNAHCYYIYRDQAMGFEYDLAKAFSEYLGVKLKIIIAEKWDNMVPMLLKGDGHIIAASFTVTPKWKTQIQFSDDYMKIQQQIIVNRDNQNIKRLKDLAGEKIHVRKGTAYQEKLEELQRQGMQIEIVPVENIPTAELIRKVARGEVAVTIADSNVAMLNRRYFPRAVIRDVIGDQESLAWAVHPDAGRLLDKINEFFAIIKQDGTFDQIYDKYYTDIDRFDYVDLRAFHRRLHSRLPRYVAIIKETAEKYGFDWRMIAAQMYQESHFQQWAKSHAGAYGLMQLTRNTANMYGVKDLYNPRQNIYAGVKHLKKLHDLFREAEGADRLFIAFAAYNIGQGHIRDAQRLARQLNLNPNKWASLTKTLPMLREWEYFKDALYGYCRGNEPVQYVRQIMIYYDILRHRGLEYDPSISDFKPQI
ncbi:MAG: membrane-bound lytic murein transglycosylase MltF [Pseudomonadota bacterium]